MKLIKVLTCTIFFCAVLHGTAQEFKDSIYKKEFNTLIQSIPKEATNREKIAIWTKVIRLTESLNLRLITI